MSTSNVSLLRVILRTGSAVFGASALLLVAAPAFFNQLLGFQTNAPLEWAMRMIGITLVALSGNMYSISSRGSEQSVRYSGIVMLVSAFGLGVLTLLIPVSLNWFTILYAIVGFSFSAAYALALSRR